MDRLILPMSWGWAVVRRPNGIGHMPTVRGLLLGVLLVVILTAGMLLLLLCVVLGHRVARPSVASWLLRVLGLP